MLFSIKKRYHIVENFPGRKLLRFGTNREFCGENFHRLLQSNYYVREATKFAETTFTGGSETAKNKKAFPLESFALYRRMFIVTKQLIHMSYM